MQVPGEEIRETSQVVETPSSGVDDKYGQTKHEAIPWGEVYADSVLFPRNYPIDIGHE